MKKIVSLFLCVLIFLPSFCFADGNLIEDTARIVLSGGASFGAVGGEWAVTGLARSGSAVPDGYFDGYYKAVEKYVTEHGGVLHQKKYTEYSRVVIALTAIGKDPKNVAGYDLLMPLGDYKKTVWQGINGSVFALIALDSGNYAVPENKDAQVKATREMYIDHILSNRTPDGGWAFSGAAADPDMTAMAVTALTPYRDRESVKSAIDGALGVLSSLQKVSGGFETGNEETAESAAQVLVALSSLGLSDDPRFVKNGKTVYDVMMSYYVPGSGFKHKMSDQSTDRMATEQCFYALVAHERAKNGQKGLFDMSNTERSHFSDVTGTGYQKAIDALYYSGVVKGMTEYSFEPGGTLTRAQFAVLIVNGLKLSDGGELPFSDVRADDWFYNAVAAAYENGIIMGVSDTSFNPSGNVTRAEAAVMIKRAAVKAGYEALFAADYPGVPPWAKDAVAFCAENGFLPDFGGDFAPNEALKRGEAAYMLAGVLKL